MLIGSASILKIDDYIYSFNSHAGIPNHPIYITRWPLSDFVAGDLMGIEWWDITEKNWIKQSQLDTIPKPVFVNGQTEFSVHYEESISKFFYIQTLEFGASNLYYRTSESINGPWSDTIKLFEPPDKKKQNIMIYAGKAHPQLSGSDLVITYATNTFELSDLLSDTLICYPRFVKLNFVK